MATMSPVSWIADRPLLATVTAVVVVVTPGFIRLEAMVDDEPGRAQAAPTTTTIPSTTTTTSPTTTTIQPRPLIPNAADPDDPEVQDLEVQDPEVQDPELPGVEIQDPEIQDPEINDPDPNDPVTVSCPEGFDLEPFKLNAPGGQVDALICTAN